MASSGEEVPPIGIAVKLGSGIGQIAEDLRLWDVSTLLLQPSVRPFWGPCRPCHIYCLSVRCHPFMVASAVPLGVCFVLLFSPIESVTGSQFGLFLWILVLTIATRASMTLYTVPHQTLGAKLSTDYDERTVLVALRHFFGAVGFIFTFVLTYVLSYAFGCGYFFASPEAFSNGQLNPAAYPPYEITLGVLMTLSILIIAFGTRSRIPYMPKAPAIAARIRARDVLGETVEAMRDLPGDGDHFFRHGGWPSHCRHRYSHG